MTVGPFEIPPLAPPAGECKGRPSTAAGRFDAAKVARMAQAIHDGRYIVDAGLIADKLIVNAGQLLGRRLG